MNLIREIYKYYALNHLVVLEQFSRHFLIAIYGVLFAAIIGIPIGFFIARRKSLSPWVIGAANVIQTVPSLALMSILMLGLGLGPTTVIATVFLYSLLPIIKNTYTGLVNIQAEYIDAALGMGMRRIDLIFKVELPLTISIIMAGIRNALVVGIGVTAIGTFIGAGGLGDIISRGVNVANGSAIIIAGALPTALMALFSDIILMIIERRLDPQNKIRKRMAN